MPNAQPGSGARNRKRADRQTQAIPPATPLSPKTDRVRVHLWPRRGLTRAEEDALASHLDSLCADQHWKWASTALIGDLWTDDTLTDADVVKHLFSLQSDPDLVRIDLSQPHLNQQSAAAWQRMRRNHPELPSLCALYCDRPLETTSVIRALGGFVPDATDQACPDGG